MKLRLLLLGLTLPVMADVRVSEAITQTRSDLRKETESLTALQADIAQQRAALLRELREREERVARLREDVTRLRTAQRQSADAVADQARDLAAARAATSELTGLVRESRRSLDARLTPAAAETVLDAFIQVDAELKDGSPEAIASAARVQLAAARDTIGRLAGGLQVSGSAIQADGRETTGTVIHLGPLQWFVSDDASVAGLLAERPEDTLPRIWSVDPAPLLDWMEGRPALLPADLTGGRALALTSVGKPWAERLKEGGITMLPLLATALASLVLVMWKALALWRVRGQDAGAVDAITTLLRTREVAGASARVDEVAQPLQTILRAGVQHARAPREDMEEIMHERMLALLPRLDRHLGTLAVLGGIAPLLGLLGTVTGMIHTFELVTVFGSGNERVLSQGISEALVTTMTGLSIAVPVLLAHAFLARRVRVIVGELEQSIARFINSLHGPEDDA